ncbi:MAG: hypothetical protein SFW65_06665 [Alphaproteobacteria bacterium]|nr:hypothetical protein [Alphaproteobacteria bacterium]
MMTSRKDQYNTIGASHEEHAMRAPRVIDVAYENQCFSDNSLSITEMVWSYDFYGIAVFDYGYFGDDYAYKGSGGRGEGAGGGYKVVNSVKPNAPSPYAGAGGGAG